MERQKKRVREKTSSIGTDDLIQELQMRAAHKARVTAAAAKSKAKANASG